MTLLSHWQKCLQRYFSPDTQFELKHTVNRFARWVIRQYSIIFQETLSALWDVSGVFVYIRVSDIVFQDNSSKIRLFYMLYRFSAFQHNEVPSLLYAPLAKSAHVSKVVMAICYLCFDSSDKVCKYEWLFVLALIHHCTVFMELTKSTNCALDSF